MEIKTPNLATICSLSPYFRPFVQHTKMKVEYPRDTLGLQIYRSSLATVAKKVKYQIEYHTRIAAN